MLVTPPRGGKVIHEKKKSRYISSQIKVQALKENNSFCVFPNCKKLATIFHHAERYAKTKNHKNIKAICKEHHDIAHAGLIKNETYQSKLWSLRQTPEMGKFDEKFQEMKWASFFEN